MSPENPWPIDPKKKHTWPICHSCTMIKLCLLPNHFRRDLIKMLWWALIACWVLLLLFGIVETESSNNNRGGNNGLRERESGRLAWFFTLDSVLGFIAIGFVGSSRKFSGFRQLLYHMPCGLPCSILPCNSIPCLELHFCHLSLSHLSCCFFLDPENFFTWE